MSTKESRGPLLYIHQPLTRMPTTKMQDVYTNKHEMGQKQEEEPKGEERRRKKPSKTREEDLEPIPVEIANEEKPHEEKSRPSFNRVKGFKEMNISERLEYLINFPKVLPPVPCVFYTANQNYQGYLSDYMEDQITIQFHDQTTKTFAVQDLKDVIMIRINK